MAKQKPPIQKPIDVKPIIKTEWFERPAVHAALLAIIAALLYAVTFQNEWALDEVISITMNSFTQKGFAVFQTFFQKTALLVLLEMQVT